MRLRATDFPSFCMKLQELKMDWPAKLIDLTYILHEIIKNVHVTYKKTLKTYKKKNYWNQNYAWPDNYD